MKIALEVRPGRPRAAEFAEEFKRELEDSGGKVAEPADTPDMVVALGGDGTMLAAVQTALEHDVPVLGFNLGTIGFLAEAEPADIKPVIRRLLTADFATEDRTTVTAAVNGVSATGVNDVVVEKVDSQRLVSLLVRVDGRDFVTYRADGLIIATPTGSTAYAFSAGGPLVDPTMDALVVTPVAAHSLFDRPMVFPASTEIEVVVASDRPVNVTVDKTDLGQLVEDEIAFVRRGPRPVRFVTFEEHDFSGKLKAKFELE